MISLIKKLLGKKSEPNEEQVKETIEEKVQETPTQSEPICKECGLSITDDNVVTYNKEKFHRKPCFRKLRKQAKQAIMSGGLA
jgi:hypothetical protein